MNAVSVSSHEIGTPVHKSITTGADLGVQPTCHRTLCAVQVLKIRRPNYFDFSVKTMVTMKLFQQQNVS